MAVLPAFLIAVTVLVISPGPAFLLVSSFSSTNGFRSGAFVALGILLAGGVQTRMVAFGLGQVMESMPAVAVAVRTVGALYLGVLGVRLVVSWFKKRSIEATETTTEAPLLSARQLVLRGLFNNLSNPKALLLFSVFLPQFTDETRSLPMQILLLGVLLSLCAFLFNLGVAATFSAVADRVGHWLSMSGRHVEGVLGLVFLGLAARLASDR